MAVLSIKNLHVKVEEKEILKGVNLTLSDHETLALLGPNGHGKSTLLNVIMGHPKYVVTEGTITLDGKDVLSMSVDERSRAGLFLAFQYPSEVPGVVNADFLKAAMNVRREKPISLFQFYRALENASNEVKIPLDMANRSLNEGFSGGEKKRNEILQMILLQPAFAMLDEIDSGLDVDALKIVSEAINDMKSDSFGCVMVSHYERLFELVPPSHVHILVDGKIVLSGGQELIDRIDKEGYRWVKELGFDFETEEDKQPIVLGSCGNKVKAK